MVAHRRRPALTVGAALSLLCLVGEAGRGQAHVVKQLLGGAVDEPLGGALASPGDLTGDGVPDFLVSAVGQTWFSGLVRLYSGADGSPSIEVTGGSTFGRSLAVLGDIDGDGMPDFAVGQYETSTVRVYSGSTGAMLFQAQQNLNSHFGFSVAGVGDQDGDGVPDLLVGAPLWAPPGFSYWTGRAWVLSGAGGATILTIDGAPIPEDGRFGYSVAGLGDLDGDSVSDFAVGAGGSTINGFPSVGYVKVYSGPTPLFSFGSPTWAISNAVTVAGVGDVSGDGIPDLAIGVPWGTAAVSQAGFVRVVSGATGAILFTWSGMAAGSRMGGSIARAGDLDGDGIPDVVVGAPGVALPTGFPFAILSGSASGFSGATGLPLFTVSGEWIDEALGTSVAGLGDVDGDGLGDVVVGAPGLYGSAGYARVLAGPAGSTIRTVYGAQAGTSVGRFVGGIGDLDGDGVREVVVADPSARRRGQVRVVSGSTFQEILLFESPEPCAAASGPLAEVGDVDLDGLPDLGIGSWGSTNCTGSGHAWVISGATGATLLEWSGGSQNDMLGLAIDGAGDVDGDGVPDVLLGSPGVPAGTASAGEATVRSGQDGSVLLTVSGSVGPLGADQLGWSVAGLGDVTGDGVPDFVAGARLAVVAGQLAAGHAKVCSGATGSVVHLLQGTAVSDRFGTAVASAGDLDGDGASEIAVGAPSFQFGGPGTGYPGYVKVFSGVTGSLLRTYSATMPGSLFGSALASSRDFDEDGVPDLVVGSPGAGVLAPSPEGRVDVYSGATGLRIDWAKGLGGGDWFGISVADAGDLDGDGFSEIVVGAPEGTNALFDPFNPGYAVVLSHAGIPEGSLLFGAGCPGSGGFVPRILTGGGPPTVSGNPAFRILLSKSLGGTFAVLAWGISAPTWLGIPLPLDLGFLGLAGCSLHVPAFQFTPAVVSGTGPGAGRGSVAFPIVANPAYAGISLDLQWYVVDPGPALVPGAMSEALRLVLMP